MAVSGEGSYSLQVGAAGEARLQTLNDIHNPYTMRVLEQLDLRPEPRVLDVGCGTGLLSCELAKLAGEGGQVVAIDASEEQLELARREARRQGRENLEFVQLNAGELQRLERKFDLIFFRFLLGHLRDPREVLRQAIDLLLPCGLLFVEEVAGIECHVSYPASKAYRGWAELVKKQQALHGTDFDIGYKLPTLIEELGCHLELASMYQPFLRGEKQKKFLTLGAIEVGPTCVQRGLMSQAELDELILGLTDVQLDDRYTLTGTRVAQVVARKPAQS